MKKNMILLSFVLTLVFAACSSIPRAKPSGEGSVTPPEELTPLPNGSGTTNTPGGINPVPTQGGPTITPEIFMPLPEDQKVFESVRQYLAQKLGIDPLTISLVEVQNAEWTDSCLGLGGPAESCLQVITPGYLVKVKAGEQVYEFHTDLSGTTIRQAL